ncbi:MAG: CopD family protein [Pseudomonadota bacterium]
MTYLTLKALHIASMVTWFAGIFYLPRLFIYHRATTDTVSLERFEIMERRLYGLMSIGAAATLVFGLGLLWINPALFKVGWFHTKLALLVGLFAYHYNCKRIMRELANGSCTHSDIWLRVYNEVPVLFLLGIIGLAVLKPY